MQRQSLNDKLAVLAWAVGLEGVSESLQKSARPRAVVAGAAAAPTTPAAPAPPPAAMRNSSLHQRLVRERMR